MRRWKLVILSESEELPIGFETNMDMLCNLDTELVSLFSGTIDAGNHKANIPPVQRNSPELNGKLARFLDRYGKVPDMYGMYKLKQCLGKLGEAAYFLVLPFQTFSTEQRLRLASFLTSLNHEIDFEKLVATDDKLFGSVMRNYECIGYGGDRSVRIGESNKNRRVCRFCKKSRPLVDFRETAHAISEGLGNKTIILNEECDTCNGTFGKTIERDLINYLSILRPLFRVPGKNGVPEIKGTNFRLEYSGNSDEVTFYYTGGGPIRELPQTVQARLYQKVEMQNIYRALCKYALSIIENKDMPDFTETMRWIRRERTSSKLPKIAVLATDRFFCQHPKIAVYLRKTNDKSLPYMVGEFHFTCLVFVYIVPFSCEDDRCFAEDEDFGVFWKCFMHYHQLSGWKFGEFSDSSEMDLAFDIQLE